MKARIFAYCTLVAIFFFVTANNIFLDRKIGELYKTAEKLDCSSEEASLDALLLKENFEKNEIYMSLTVNHDKLSNIEDAIAELEGALTVGKKEEAEIIKSRLKNALLHLWRLSGFNLDGII